jgi:hypothetical protein
MITLLILGYVCMVCGIIYWQDRQIKQLQKEKALLESKNALIGLAIRSNFMVDPYAPEDSIYVMNPKTFDALKKSGLTEFPFNPTTVQ